MDDESEGQGNSASGHWQLLSHETGEHDAGNIQDADGMYSAAEGVGDEQDDLVDIDDGDADEAIDIVTVRFGA